ncbi:MAG: NUDIX hydrolase [Clostridia bacterium]|nr:NUDIX hydrolase [Clostridia bacterium]
MFRGRVVNLRVDEVLLQNSNTSTREIVEHSGGVCILPIDSEDNIIFVKQYRSPFEKIITELPAGKLEKGEDPLDCGIRELKEETGCTADKIYNLGEIYPSVGYTQEVLYLFAATDLEFGEKNLDENEFLQSYKIPLKDAVSMVLSGELKDAKTVSAIMKFAMLRDCGHLEKHMVLG